MYVDVGMWVLCVDVGMWVLCVDVGMFVLCVDSACLELTSGPLLDVRSNRFSDKKVVLGGTWSGTRVKSNT
jgi:hypothetical protein